MCHRGDVNRFDERQEKCYKECRKECRLIATLHYDASTARRALISLPLPGTRPALYSVLFIHYVLWLDRHVDDIWGIGVESAFCS